MKLTATEKAKTPYKFFYDNAGWSYTPGKETEAQGKRRSARELAKAEAWATANQCDYQWSIDPDIDSSHFTDEKPHWKLWCCVMIKDGEQVQSLYGIDFGRGGDPWSDTYKRVIEAELASQEMP